MSFLRRTNLAPIAASFLVALAAGCGGGGGSGHGAASVPTSFSHAAFRPANFGPPAPAANRWLPLTPGTQWIRVGTTDIGHRAIPHRVISTVTSVSKAVDGVTTVAVLDQDVDAGQIVQQSLDFFAQDKRHNVWAVGSYTEEYEGGRFVLIRDAWLGGVDGGRPGILMPAAPTIATPPFTIAQPPGADPDAAQIVATRQHQCVPLRCFTDVLVVREGKASALDNEFKFYAPGVGQILNAPKARSAHKDVEALVNLIHLTPRGLAEINAETLKLDRHSRHTKRAVFGRSAPARRSL